MLNDVVELLANGLTHFSDEWDTYQNKCDPEPLSYLYFFVWQYIPPSVVFFLLNFQVGKCHRYPLVTELSIALSRITFSMFKTAIFIGLTSLVR